MVRIAELRIKNFRSFGAGPRGSGQKISFSGPITFVVGENNAGKSNVLAALSQGLAFAAGTQPGLADYHRKTAGLELTLAIRVEFDATDYPIMEKAFPVRTGASHVTRSALRLLFPSCEVSSTHSSRQRTVSWKSNGRVASGGLLQPDSSTALAEPPSILPFDGFMEQLKSFPDAKDAAAVLAKAGLEPARTVINLGTDVATLLGNVVIPRVGVFEEVRLRPRGRGQGALQSYDGSLVADVLHTLKNGNREQRDRYERIRTVFRSIFPDLKLEVTGQTQAPQILVEQAASGLEVDLDRSGAGIGQVVTILANMVDAQGMVFAVDTPESNLHPHGLRSLTAFFEDVARSNQLVLATHSPLVVPPSQLDSVIAIRQVGGKSFVAQVSPTTLTVDEKSKLRHLLGPEAREMMFSRKVIFVEGESELGALPILFGAILKDPNREGISIVPVDGKHFGKFVKVARALGISFSVLCDRDAIMNIETTVRGEEGPVRCSVVLEQMHDLGFVSYKWVRSIWESVKGTVDRGRPSPKYPPRVVDKLVAKARRHRVFVWPSDLETVLESSLPNAEVERIAHEAKGKVVRGRALASALVERGRLPPDIETMLRNIARMRAKGGA